MTAVPELVSDLPNKGVSPKRCSGTNADGSECKTPEHLLRLDPEAAEWWCFSHDPTMAEERLLAQRKGGLRSTARSRRYTYLNPDDLGRLETAEDARALAAQIVRAAATGRLNSSSAQACLKGLREWLQAHDAVELTQRLAVVEQRLDESDADAERARQARATKAQRTGEYMTRPTPSKEPT